MTRGSSDRRTKCPRARVKVGEVQTLRSLLGRIRALPPGRADALLAAALLAEGLVEILVLSPLHGADLALVLGVIVVQAAALAVRRRWPVLPLLALYGLEPVLQSVGKGVTDNMAGPFFWMLLAGYTWGMHTEGARLWAGAVFASATLVLGSWLDAYSDGFTSYLSTVCLIALRADAVRPGAAQPRAAEPGPARPCRARRARARGGRRRRRARGAHAHRRRPPRRRRPRAERDDRAGRRRAADGRARPGARRGLLRGRSRTPGARR